MADSQPNSQIPDSVNPSVQIIEPALQVPSWASQVVEAVASQQVLTGQQLSSVMAVMPQQLELP